MVQENEDNKLKYNLLQLNEKSQKNNHRLFFRHCLFIWFTLNQIASNKSNKEGEGEEGKERGQGGRGIENDFKIMMSYQQHLLEIPRKKISSLHRKEIQSNIY